MGRPVRVCSVQSMTLLPIAVVGLVLCCSQISNAQEATESQTLSQAGCACLSTWFDAAGIERSGCANPDNDPMGDWCQVSPATCLGYYGVYTSANGSDVFYDYCGDVREKTESGCLCAPDWSMGPSSKIGKPHYRDRCARPEGPTSKRKCRTDLATCPADSTVGEFDICADTVETLTIDKQTTYHKCTCATGWQYLYADGTRANFSGCANPDGDPMGPWCAVDPASCDHFAGEITMQTNQTLGYDYCNKKYRHPEPNSCAAVLKEFDQCGGKSGCSDFGCQDAPWPGACCPEGTLCHRQDAFYYQCLSPYNAQKLQDAKQLEAMSGDLQSDLQSETPTGPDSQAGSDQSLDAASDLDGTLDSSAAAQQVEAVTIHTKLKVDMDYDQLVGSADMLSSFKSDVVTFLRSSTASLEYIQDAGITEILRGSVVAVAYVTFKPEAPASVVDLAANRLRSSTDRLYAESSLASAWGPLVSYLVAADAASLHAHETAKGGAAEAKRPKMMAPGAAAGVAVGVIAAVAISSYVVYETLHSKKNKADNCTPTRRGNRELKVSAVLAARIGTYIKTEQGKLHTLLATKKPSKQADVSPETELQVEASAARRVMPTDRPVILPVRMSDNPLADDDENTRETGTTNGTDTADASADKAGVDAGALQSPNGAARAAPDAAFLPDAEDSLTEDDIDLTANPVGLLRTIYGPQSVSSGSCTLSLTHVSSSTESSTITASHYGISQNPSIDSHLSCTTSLSSTPSVGSTTPATKQYTLSPLGSTSSTGSTIKAIGGAVQPAGSYGARSAGGSYAAAAALKQRRTSGTAVRKSAGGR